MMKSEELITILLNVAAKTDIFLFLYLNAGLKMFLRKDENFFLLLFAEFPSQLPLKVVISRLGS